MSSTRLVPAAPTAGRRLLLLDHVEPASSQHLIRGDLKLRSLPAHLMDELLKRSSMMRVEQQR
jgi:hypothetical protein